MDEANEGHLLSILAQIESHLAKINDRQEDLIKLKLAELYLRHGVETTKGVLKKVDW